MSQRRSQSQKGEQKPPESAAPDAAASESSADDEQDPLPAYKTVEEADTARGEGLKLYNAEKFDEAIRIQEAVVRFYTSKYGDLDARCALPILDYGLTLLAQIQTNADAAASVFKQQEDASVAEEDMELCFLTLDAARICFEKQAQALPDDETVQLRLAEVHDALASLRLEGDNEDEAIAEFSFVLTILKAMKTSNVKRIVGALFSLARAHESKGEISDAIKVYKEALETAKKATGLYTPAEIAEIERYYTDASSEAKELKEEGGMDKIKEEIRGCFPDEAEQVPPPDEVAAPPSSAFVAPLPAEFQGRSNSRSIPAALMVSIPAREDSGKSNSISFFPPQGNSAGMRSTVSDKVNIVPVRKKPKSTENSVSVATAFEQSANNSNSCLAPPAKKQRVETAAKE